MRMLQIKQAECALADGRLDEACELIADSDLRAHRRGQELLGRLVAGLIARGERHLAAGNAPQALADCEKARDDGGNLPEAAELRARIAEHLAGGRHRQQRRGERVAAAREHIENGRLSLGEDLLADAGADSVRAEGLRHEAAARRAAAEAAMRRASAALKREDHAAAIDELLTARASRADTDEMADLAARVVDASAGWARQEMVRGRLDLGEPLLRRLAGLAGGNRQVQDLLGVADQCHRGGEHIRRGLLREAGEVLRRAAAMLPEAKWLRQAVADAERGAAAAAALRRGPLGMLPAPQADRPEARQDDGGAAGETPVVLSPVEARPGRAAGVPGRFVLQVDGAGSTLVLRDRQVTVGPISSSARPDLGLLADPDVPVVTIERTESDYFLRSAAPVSVNDRPVMGKLLADGDKIALSPRCRMRFLLPNAASASAVLELSGARLPQADVRRVVLMDRELILGPGAAVHVRAEHLSDRAVLHLRDGRLLCRTTSPLTVDRKPMDPADGIPLGVPVRIGPVGLVITRI